MKIFDKIRHSNFFIKLTHWEFWPFHVIYLPVFFYWGWLCLKARSFFFFSASNPGIENGGMLGESKFSILKKINPKYIPVSLYIEPSISPDQLLEKVSNAGLQFPVIAKPDIGERGWMVEKINSKDELDEYLNRIKVDFIIQEYVHLPMEAGIFYYRYPDQSRGHISSVVIKEPLRVTGDGNSTLRELIFNNPRAKLQLRRILQNYNGTLENVVPMGNTIVLEPIGNHCRGATFLNGNHYISERLTTVMDKISKDIDGFYFGRYDIRCNDLTDLNNIDLKILELNGAGSEPGHIYHPGASLIEAYKSILKHLNILYRISKINHQKGTKYMSLGEGIRQIKRLRQYNRMKKAV